MIIVNSLDKGLRLLDSYPPTIDAQLCLNTLDEFDPARSPSVARSQELAHVSIN
ncbi:hypothetical protein NVP1238A_07 [Vibrio phage 1.238.A._10N.261.52.F10]|uniref:Uncharacterized protein n=2 Tax=Pariacacavirus TaxID=2948856 RepID=A0A2I7RUB2_9CAUD|nr:hypothetical protein KNT79_gp07 [Vibrio phage 1.238.A._10N.261.52.F10]YP_010093453.1 hypothetical protein KNT80_gp10 [Vibrio phage 1.245.O._10N.261.54.C7]AUR97256.1 hypothetical protein NVP1238A_07 [Vibrio phage 1.238.A._10N.261.52.F10]AUR97350.1 hypothetical protein NVP1238B_08 [Vibrio phage 1.238.B._10N.261.52.F10]AUR97923.1 hypothetical protein NVP1245O_10 [Vibrio phage 1.245.O._10N.261.54.C7]